MQHSFNYHTHCHHSDAQVSSRCIEDYDQENLSDKKVPSIMPPLMWRCLGGHACAVLLVACMCILYVATDIYLCIKTLLFMLVHLKKLSVY